MRKINVVELFAGVGGFRLGLDAASSKKLKYETIWANQWEPSTKLQHAAKVYVDRFGTEGFSSVDIEKVIENDFDSIPDHDLLVGGFPCQDYSVARTLSHARGLIGEKGVLWWSIYTILRKKGKNAPNYLMLENVDRLLKSPAKQRGRDFAIMLGSLADLDYAVEWRVINAADYGMPQRRRRVFILGYKKGTKMYEKIKNTEDKANILIKEGTIPSGFQVKDSIDKRKDFVIEGKLKEISKDFSSYSPKLSPFENAGVMIDRNVTTAKVTPSYNGKRQTLNDVLIVESDVPEEFFINGELDRWNYLKGGKKEVRKTKSGHAYNYSEGGMVFPDALDKPSRTIVTGEGGSTPSRFKHVVRTESGRLRRLTPLELERLNMFPDNHTRGEGDAKRAFFMGNALVVGVIEKLGNALADTIDK
jgi:DNA (cytosine-5)-methyltransferase 1